jgi:hypothetical protein
MAGLTARSLLAIGLMLTLLAAGCALMPTRRDQPVIIDGLSIGGPAGCGACTDPPQSPNCGPCDSVAAIARREIDAAWPDYPEIVAVTFHNEGAYFGPGGEQALQTRSGHLYVAVATFADGRMHAVGIYCGVTGCLYLP